MSGGRGAEHDMDLSRLSSLLAIIGALNIFYAMYGLIQVDFVKMMISTVTYLTLMYAAAIIDTKAEALRQFDRARARALK